MLQTKNVFIDTECYIRTKLNLDNIIFNTFKNLCSSSELDHVTTSTVKREVNRKIDESVKEAVDALTKFQRAGQILNSLHSADLQPLFKKVEEGEVNAIAKQRFNKYLAECNSDTAYAEKIDGEDILTRYFERKAPFTKDKDNEFRDSISLLSLKKWLETEYNEKAYVVSGDKALESYCEDDDDLIYVHSLGDLIDLYNQHNDARTEKIKSYMNQHVHKIKSDIETFINDCDVYNFSNWEDAEVDSFTVIHVSDFDPSIIHIDDEECQIVFDIDIDIIIRVSVTGPDYNNGTYDKEEGVMYTSGISTKETEVKLDFSVELELSYELDDGEFINIDVNSLFIRDASNGIEVEIEENEEPEYY
jgi:hypothetical protein